MNDKLAKREIPGWGEDLSTFLETCRKEGDSELALQVEEKLLASYLMGLRRSLDEDITARRWASEAEPAVSAKGAIADRFWDQARPGSEDVFERAVEILLSELDEARKRPPSLYLVDHQTGRAVVPITEETVFQPPDYVGEDGLTYKARPVVHPAITSALALARQEEAKKRRLLAKAADPASKHAFAHVSGPEGIVQSAIVRLAAIGISVMDDMGEESTHEVEFGRESSDGTDQSPNLMFHRQNSFGAVLALKVVKLCGPGGSCRFGTPREAKNSRQKWYVVPVTVRERPSNLPV